MTGSKKKVIYQDENCYGLGSNKIKPYLIGSECKLCGHIAFPPQVVCAACMTDGSMKEVSLGNRGVIDTFSVLYMSAPDFEAPYVLADVRLPNGVKLLSMITGYNPSEGSLKTGSKVELIIEKIRKDEQGNEIIGYKFRPVPVKKGRIIKRG